MYNTILIVILLSTVKAFSVENVVPPDMLSPKPPLAVTKKHLDIKEVKQILNTIHPTVAHQILNDYFRNKLNIKKPRSEIIKDFLYMIMEIEKPQPLRRLLQLEGVQVDAKMIAEAIKQGNPSILQHLIDHLLESGGTIPEKALLWIDYTKPQSILILDTSLASGANPNASSKKYPSPAHKAFLEGNEDAVNQLFDYGTDANRVNKKGENFLLWALSQRPIDDKDHITDTILASLIGRLKSIHKLDLNAQTKLGETAIELAIKYKKYESLKEIIAHGGDVNQLSHDGIPLLVLAILNHDTESFNILIEAQANPNKTNTKKENTLILALKLGPEYFPEKKPPAVLKMVKKLVTVGANTQVLDSTGNSTMDLAQQSWPSDITQTLQTHGATFHGDHLLNSLLCQSQFFNPNKPTTPPTAH